jgi:hypothetical protein
MKRTLLILTLTISFLPAAYSQTGKRRPGAQKPPAAQSTGTTNTAAENSVSGSLTFNAKTVALQYVYAKPSKIDDKPGILLYFTDRPIVEVVAEDQFQAKAKAGEVNGIYVRLDAATKRAVGYEIGMNKEYLLVYNYNYSRASGEGFDGEVFNLTTPNPATLQGTVSANRTTKRLDMKSSLSNPRYFPYVYQFNLTFKAQLKKDAWTGNFGVYPPIALEPGRAEGEMTDKGQKKGLNYVRARMDSSRFKGESELTLIFTEQPFSQREPGKEHTPYLQIRVNPKTMKVHGMDVMYANGNSSQGSSGMGGEFTIKNGNLLEGRFTFPGLCNVSCKVLIEADPDAPVEAGAGKPLPAGGGEVGKAFLQFMNGLENAKTLEEMAELFKRSQSSTAEASSGFNEKALQNATAKEKKETFDLVRAFFVFQDLKVTGGLLNKDRATLSVIGVQDKDEVKGDVNMFLEGGQWKIGKVSLSPTGKFVRPKQPALNPDANAASKNAAMAVSNGSVGGTFSVDGKTVNLKYVYALRRPSMPPMTAAALELLVTDKPVPEAILKTITAKEMRLFYLDEDYFKGTSITGIFFWISKGSGNGGDQVGYFQTLIAPESYQLDIKKFSSFTMQKGKLKAKAVDKGEKGGIKWNYALDLSAALEALPSPTGLPDTTFAGTPIGVPPDEGKASGSIEKKGSKTIKLNVAYVWRAKNFFDEPDETIYVLATERSVAKDKDLFADSSEIYELGEQGKLPGVLIMLEPAGTVLSGTVLLDRTSYQDFYGRPTVSGFKIENGRVKGRAEYKSDDQSRTYTLTFDAPLKQ